MPSRAELFFIEVKEQGSKAFAFLEGLADRNATTDENEWREFKEASSLNLAAPERKKQAQAIWSESLSAFANSGGGVLIWGIRAPSRIADGLSLAANAAAFADRLRDWVNDAADPPVLSVDILALPRSATQPEGFVVCCIPPSPLSPHRAKWAVREYYIRTQDGSHPCTTGTLRRLFYP